MRIKKDYLYVAYRTATRAKIGITDNPKERLAVLRRNHGSALQYFHVWYLPTIAWEFESAVIRTLDPLGKCDPAEWFDMSAAQLNDHIELQIKAGIPSEPTSMSDRRRMEMESLRRLGQTLAQIGNQWGLSRQRVHQILNRHRTENI